VIGQAFACSSTCRWRPWCPVAAEVLLSRLSNGAGTDTPVLSQDAGHQYIAFWTGFASGTSVDVSVRLNAAWQTERMSPQAPRYRGYRFPGSLRKKRAAVGRSPHGPAREQSSGSLPSTGPAAETPNPSVQIRRPRAAVSLSARARSESLSGRPSPADGRLPLSPDGPLVPRLG
jgi:hypothetical protein